MKLKKRISDSLPAKEFELELELEMEKFAESIEDDLSPRDCITKSNRKYSNREEDLA